MLELNALASDAVRWLGANALDGTLFALVVWVVSVTLLRRATGRVMALIWLAALVKFVIVQPVEMHAVPRRVIAMYRASDVNAVVVHYDWLAIGLTLAYGVTVAALLTRLIVRQARLATRIRAFGSAEPEILRAVREAAGALSLATLPDVRVTEACVAPFIVGPWRPTLVLPRQLCVPGARLHAVLLHELAHLQRRDHWFLWFERIVATSFFFWPPVHWITQKLDEARELACDERAIQRGRFSAAEYGQHLVDVVASVRVPLALGAALAVVRTPVKLERRIDRLLEEPWSLRAGWMQVAALVLLGTGLVLGLRPVRQSSARVPVVLTSNPEGLSCGGGKADAPDAEEPTCVRQACGQCIP